ncbi:Uncharacterized protein dnm_012370 [Desulfonema magnum]|uniref:Uncharacterized protein n=1 Tax=Desulfonema magnum TaxID=45655 RepID=A0A975BGY4_9BACT|nr:Uncharacterized protein dnm_012370 [Desulfonema magnum]
MHHKYLTKSFLYFFINLIACCLLILGLENIKNFCTGT